MCLISAWNQTKMQTIFLLIPTSGLIFTPHYTLQPGPDSNLLTNLQPPINPVTGTMN